jgi:phosphoglycerate dehydrogenase-like enzyme
MPDAGTWQGMAVPVRIAVLDDYQRVAAHYADWAQLPDAEIDFVAEHLDAEQLVRRVAGCSVIVAMRERTAFPREILEQLPELRLLVTTGMRNAAIDMVAARDRGVLVAGTDLHGPATTELTWAFVLDLVRPVGDYDRAIRAGGWQESVAGDLTSLTLGLVGLGRLGSRVARIARAFEMPVIAWSQHLSDERAAEHGVRRVGKQELFAGSDIVSVHLILGASTRGIVGRDELRAMRPDAHLINTSRAGLVDQDALRVALEEGWIAGACLDVFDVEPLPADHWLRSAPRTRLSPHMGYVTDATYRVCYPQAVEDIAAFLAGAPIRVAN